MQVVIFDLDGTLLDTRERIFWQFEELTREFDGAAASRRDISAAMHGSLEEVIRTLVKNERAPFDVVMARHATLYKESLGRVRLYPGVQDLLPILRRMGVRIAALSNSDDRILESLDITGIRPYFDLIITNKHVSNPKPHPEGVLLVLQHLGVSPDQAAMIGDTPADIHAGKQANLAKTIAVSHGFGTLEDLNAAAPTHLVEDIPSILDVLDARVGL